MDYDGKNNFRDQLQQKSIELIERFSLPLDLGFDYIHQPEKKKAWVEDVVLKHPELTIKADLTFRQAINYNLPPILGERPVNPKRSYITRWDAIGNISQFVERMNYACYKNAYKRYGKRLRIVSAIEGGKIELERREENGTTYQIDFDTGKNIHAHLILSKPKHIDFDAYKKLILDNWLETKWGLWKRRIEPIRSLRAVSGYQVKTSLSALDFENTNLQ
jgi:hypothetical protein